MPKSFHVNILAPEKKIFEGEIFSLVVPAALGYLGVLADHVPLIAGLLPGKIILKDNAGQETVLRNESGGYLEFSGNMATILLDSVGQF